MAFAAGQSLKGSRYTVERELGRGRFGVTYLTHRQDGSRWVIKTLNESLLQSLKPADKDRLQSMFWQEAVKLSQCRHPHIVKVREPFIESGVGCIPMEYIDGITLTDRAERQLPETRALEYVRQVGEGLVVFHQIVRSIHRDIKPANIMVRSTGEAVLIDFGLALEFDQTLATIRTNETSEGFTPLEMYSHHTQKPGAYTDVYGLAATLYELLTGKPPVSAIKREVDKANLTPPIQLNPQISDRTNRMILKGMALKPKDRPQSMREWLDSLGLTAPVAGSSPLPVVPVQGTVNWTKWGVIWTAAAAVVALLVGLPALIAFFKPPPSLTPVVSPSAPSPTPTKTTRVS